MVAAKIANMGSGGYQSKTANLRVSQPEAAEQLNVSERSVNTAKKVQRENLTSFSPRTRGRTRSKITTKYYYRIPPRTGGEPGTENLAKPSL